MHIGIMFIVVRKLVNGVILCDFYQFVLSFTYCNFFFIMNYLTRMKKYRLVIFYLFAICCIIFLIHLFPKLHTLTFSSTTVFVMREYTFQKNIMVFFLIMHITYTLLVLMLCDVIALEGDGCVI